jgi:hypothetical protein
VCDLLLCYAVLDFFVKARGRADHVDIGIGVETVEDPP